ncbi:MAG: hypothetical protein HYV09_29630 [Deltaproteobacteria bacterium]|nr:hypothetical protein [Deltaproteobacteria bacterium]
MAPPIPPNCSACGAPLPAGTDRCARCGALHGDHRRCAGCGAKAEVIRKGGLIFVCAACGRPRVPAEQPFPRSGREREALAKADADLKSSVMATALGIVAFVVAAAALGTASLAFLLGFGFLALLAFVATFLFAGAGAFGLVTARGARGRADEQMRDAFGSVAVDVMRVRGAISPPQLAEVLGVPEEVADQALARLPARTDVRVDTVLDERAVDGQVRYRVADATLPAAAVDEAADFEARLQASIRAKGQQ